jgi:hypothetical protein
MVNEGGDAATFSLNLSTMLCCYLKTGGALLSVGIQLLFHIHTAT